MEKNTFKLLYWVEDMMLSQKRTLKKEAQIELEVLNSAKVLRSVQCTYLYRGGNSCIADIKINA